MRSCNFQYAPIKMFEAEDQMAVGVFQQPGLCLLGSVERSWVLLKHLRPSLWPSHPSKASQQASMYCSLFNLMSFSKPKRTSEDIIPLASEYHDVQWKLYIRRTSHSSPPGYRRLGTFRYVCWSSASVKCCLFFRAWDSMPMSSRMACL